MKLKTRIEGTAGDYLLVLDGDSDMPGDDQLEHDAAAAHALMLALDRWASRRADHASYATFLIGHADELMTQWGLDSGEVDGHE